MSWREKPHRAEGVVSAHVQEGFDVRCEWGLSGIAALAAGAVVAALDGSKSPEATTAERMFAVAGGDLKELVRSCASAREIIDRGFAADVEVAVELDDSDVVPVLEGGQYRA